MNIVAKLIGVLLLAAAFIITCNRSAVDDNTDDDETGAVVVSEALVSECGGFSAEKSTRSAADSTETMTWEYEASSKTLRFHHAALMLNCCGVHTVDAWFEDGMVGIEENDQPAEGGRCKCICPFDFNVTLTGIEQDSVEVSILLTIDDDTTEHWTGTIDCAQGSGTVVIKNPPDDGAL